MLKSFGRNESGAVALIFGLAVIPLVLAVGVAVDYSRAASVHSHLQDIADAAALAGARENSDNIAIIEKTARAYFDAHVPPGMLGQLKSFNVTMTPDGAVRVAVAGDVDTTFTNIAGIKAMDVNVASEVMRAAKGSLEVALVLDNTGSMSGDKLKALKKVSKELVEDIDANADLEARFGVVPFAEYVNIGSGLAGASWLDMSKVAKPKKWDGCVGSRSHPLNVGDDTYATKIPALDGVSCPKQEIVALTDDSKKVTKALNKMEAQNCTYIPSGLAWGYRLLSPGGPFTEGESYDPDNREPRKVLVLLTDGANTMSPANFPLHTPAAGCSGWASVAKSNDYVTELCNNVKKQKIEIFTIAFDVSDNGIKTILEGCASGPSNYFDADDTTELEQTFAALTESFQNLRISR